MIKRILCSFLILCIIFTDIPASVFADDTANQTSVEEDTVNSDSAAIEEDEEVPALLSTAVDKGKKLDNDLNTDIETLVGAYHLEEDLTLTRDLRFGKASKAASTCTLYLNGHVLNLNGHYIYVYSGTTLSIEDDGDTVRYFSDNDNDGCYESYSTASTTNSIKTIGGVITGGTGEASKEKDNNFNIYVSNNSTLNMNGGNIVGNKLISNTEISATGAGIYCFGTINMNGGQISGNAVMSDASSNLANYGGAVLCSENAEFNFYGGVISYNTASGNGDTYGGAIYAQINSEVNISGGKIFNNNANNGGAIAALNSSVNISGGEIYSNESSEQGGAIAVDQCYLKITNGSITGNETGYSGGAIMNINGTVTIEGGTISDNKSGDGGALFNTGKLSIDGGTISGNTASYGGAIFNDNATQREISLKITGGTFTGNKAQTGCSIYAKSGFTLGGDVSFDAEKNTFGNNSTVYLKDGVLITPESDYSGTCYVSRENRLGVISTVTTSGMAKHFVLDFPKYGGRNYSIQYNKDNRLEIVKSAPSITVKTDGDGTAEADKTTASVGEEVTVSYSSEYPYILDEIKAYEISGSDLIEIDVKDCKFTMPDNNVLVKVTFKPDYRSVTIATTQNGTVSLNKTKGIKDEEIIFSVTPAEGYILDEYKVYKTGDSNTTAVVVPVDDEENKYHFAMPEYDTTVEVSFCLSTERKYNIIYATAGASGTISGDKTTAKSGETVTLEYTENSPYIFEYYKVFKSDDKNTVVEVVDGKFTMPAFDVRVTAGYQKGYVITCETSDKGTVSVSVDKNAVKCNTTVILSNNPSQSYVFDGYTAYKTEDPTVSIPVVMGMKDGEIVYYFDMPNFDVTVSANFCKEEDKLYNILIANCSNGQVSADVSKAKAGDKVTLSNTPDSSYINVGYLVCKLDDTTTTISVTDGSFIMPAYDVAVYSGFVKGYTITSKNCTGGKVSTDVSIAREGKVITLSNEPDSGYEFDEYRVYKTGDPTETVKVYSNGQFYMPAYDITIEATFTNIAEKEYKISIYEEATYGTSSINKTKAKEGETITLSNTTNNSYILAYYTVYKASDYRVSFDVTNGSFTMPAYNVIIVPAYYTGYNITVETVEHGTASVNKTLAKVKDVISINAEPDSGYLIDSIEVYKTGDPQTTVSVSDGKFTMPKYDVTVKVSYISKADKLYSITSKANTKGTVSTVENSKTGQEITINVTPKKGYKLESLKVYKTGAVNTTVAVNDGKFTMPEYDVTVEASFVRAYSVTIQNPSGGTIAIKDNKVIAKAGETVNLENTPAENSVFVKYIVYKTIDKNTTVQVTDGSFVMPSYDVTVSAEYNKEYIIKTDESIAHGTVGASKSKTVEKEVVTLTCTPEDDSYCLKECKVYKTGDENTTVEVINKFGLYYFYMPDYDVTVSAEFVKISSITVLDANNGTIQADKTTAKTGETVSLSYTPDTLYKLKQYSVYYMAGGVKTEVSVTNDKFTMPEYDVTVEASFEDATHKISKEGSNFTYSITRITDTGKEDTALEGDTVSISCIPDAGYILDSYTVCKDDTDKTEITVTNNSFVMPDCDVLIIGTTRERDKNDVKPTGPVANCFTFTSDVPFKIEVTAGYDGYLYYSTDGSNWNNVSDTSGVAGVCSADTKNNTDNKYYLYFAGKANTVITKNGSHWTIGDTEYTDTSKNRIHITDEKGVKVNSSGNIMTLLDYANPDDQIMGESAFYNMFAWCPELLTAPELPATTLADNCYYGMFIGCTSLTTVPDLPATTLADNCYSYMFKGCTSLTAAPDLPATTLADYCYSNMFWMCTGLTTAPDLPATTLADNCYSSMFKECTSLTEAPDLLAMTLADECYKSMFEGCTGLTTSPLLPSKDVKTRCYEYMFKGCSKLKVTTVKPEEGCYNAYYFYDDADLSAYDYMFEDTASGNISTPRTDENDSKLIYYITIYANGEYSYSENDKVTLEDKNNVSEVALAYTGSRVVVDSDISLADHNGKIYYTKNEGSSTDITLSMQYDISLDDTSTVIISHCHPDYDSVEFKLFPENDAYLDDDCVMHYTFKDTYYYFYEKSNIKKLQGDIEIAEGKELVLCLNGQELVDDGYDIFGSELQNKIINNGDLTIYNCKDGGSLDIEIINNGTLTISGNIELKGASKITNNGSLTLKGDVKDTAGIVNNGTITLSGNVQVSGSSENIKLATGKYITLVNFTGKAGVTVEGGKGQITTNGSESDIKRFTSDNADYTVKFNTENGYLYLAGEETEPDPEQSEVSVVGVDIYPTKLSMHEDEDTTLAATVFPENATNKKYSWKSSNEEVATVDENGTVRALKVGTATITVTTEDKEKTATCSVTVTKLTVSPTSKTLKMGESTTLEATMEPDSLTDKSVVWYSDNAEIAEVNPNTGVVTAKGVGTTTITAVSNADGSSAKCSVTVEKGNSSVTKNPVISDNLTYDAKEHDLAVEGTAKNGTLYYALGENDTKAPESGWSEEIPTGINAGTYYVWYKSVGISEDYFDTDPVYLGKVIIEQKELEVSVGTAKIVKGYDGSKESGTLTGEIKVTGIASSDKLVKVSCIDIPDYSDKVVGDNYTLKTGISITGDLNSNYKLKNNVTSISIPGEITKKEIVVKSGIEATDRSYKAGDKSISLSTENAILDGKVPGEDLTISVDGEMSDDKAGENKKIVLTNLSLTGASIENYTLAESGNQSETTVTIAKIKVSVPQANMKLVYDGTEKMGVTLPAGAEYTIQGNTATNASDSYSAIATLKDPDNYEWELDEPTSEDQTIAWSIAKKEISVTADNKETYVGFDLVALTYNSDSLCGNDSLTGELSTAANKDAIGTYDISQGTLSAGDNYSITYTKGTYAVKDKTSQSLSFANSSITKTYGNSSFTQKVSGAKTAVTYSSSDTSVAEVDANGKVKIIKAGTVTIKASVAETEKYKGNEATYSLTVNKVKVDLPSAKTDLIYDGTLQTGVELSDNAKYTIEGNTAKNASDSYSATVTLDDADNYEWNLATPTSSDQTITWSIAKKEVTVTAENKTMNLGETVPEFTATVSGLIGKDKVTYSFNSLNPSSQGVYTIIPAGDEELSNYSITYVQGYLTVTKTDSDAKADTSDVTKVLEKYQDKQEFNNKTLDVEVRTSENIPQADKDLITQSLSSDKKIQFADANLFLIIKDNTGTTEKNIGDENDTLISVTYKFDFTNKRNIRVLRVHNGVVDEITKKPNADGEYVTFNNKEGTITVTAMKYSTYAFSYKVMPASQDEPYKVVNTGVSGAK